MLKFLAESKCSMRHLAMTGVSGQVMVRLDEAAHLAREGRVQPAEAKLDPGSGPCASQNGASHCIEDQGLAGPQEPMLLLCGDFNTTPDAPACTVSPKPSCWWHWVAHEGASSLSKMRLPVVEKSPGSFWCIASRTCTVGGQLCA